MSGIQQRKKTGEYCRDGAVVFINCSNHPSERWGERQREEAEKYGEIVDVPFPEVDPAWPEERIGEEAENICRKICQYNVAAVMCQGEFTLSYAIVSRLKERGIPVFAACSSRKAVETVNPDGSTRKEVLFCFERFRRY